VNRKPKTIEYRNSTQRDALQGRSDFPPTPESQNPDWWHVWRPSAGEEGQDRSLRRRPTAPSEQSGALRYMPRAVYDKVREACQAQGPIKADQPRDQLKVEHAVLAQLLLRQLQKENAYAAVRPKVYEEIATRMKSCLSKMLRNANKVEPLNQECLALWEQCISGGQGQWLFMTQYISQQQPGWQRSLCDGNVAVMDAILEAPHPPPPHPNPLTLSPIWEELIKLRSPSAQDDWTVVKNVMANAVEGMKQGRLE
jgi:hypothetical protein